MIHGSSGCIRKARRYYRRFGRVTVVLGRFVVGLRALVAPLAGSTRMPYWRFLLLDAGGAFLWAGVFMGAGHALGSQAQVFSQWFRGASLVVGLMLLAAFAAYLGLKRWRRHRRGAAPAGASSPCASPSVSL